jgi:hypothetical protein
MVKYVNVGKAPVCLYVLCFVLRDTVYFMLHWLNNAGKSAISKIYNNLRISLC